MCEVGEVVSSYAVLSDVYEHNQTFLTRLNICSEIPLSAELAAILGKVMTGVFCITALSTTKIKWG